MTKRYIINEEGIPVLQPPPTEAHRQRPRMIEYWKVSENKDILCYFHNYKEEKGKPIKVKVLDKSWYAPGRETLKVK